METRALIDEQEKQQPAQSCIMKSDAPSALSPVFMSSAEQRVSGLRVAADLKIDLLTCGLIVISKECTIC